MSAKREQRAFCRIEDYLDAKYPKVAELIRATCVDMTLRSTRGKGGITLLLPIDKAFLEKVEAKVYSDDPREASSACDMLNAVILRDCYKDGKSMKDAAASGGLANSLFPAQAVEVKSATATKVEFASGATAELDKGFIDSSPKGNLAVWLLSGSLPVTKDKPANLLPRRKGPMMKTGSYQDEEQSQKLRYLISVNVENHYAGNRLMNSKDDPYCKMVSSLMDFICTENHELFAELAPLIHHSIMDFYVLVEPHRKTGFRIDEDTIQRWWKDGKKDVDCLKVWAKIDAVLKEKSGAISALKEFARKQRSELSGSAGRSIADSVVQVYQKAEKLAEAISPKIGNHIQMIVEDTLRYYTWVMCCDPRFDIGRYNNMLQVIGDAMYSLNADKEKFVSPILNRAQILYHIDPREPIGQCMAFVNSSAFLSVPFTSSECKGMSSKVTNVHDFNFPISAAAPRTKEDIMRLLEGKVDDETRARIAEML